MAYHEDSDSGIVYSTGQGRICPGCGRPIGDCSCVRMSRRIRGRKDEVPKADGIVRIGRETKGRKGKGVTVIKGAPLDHEGLVKLAKELKARCSAGGTVKEDVIEIQGDHRERLTEELKKKGWTVKRSGG